MPEPDAGPAKNSSQGNSEQRKSPVIERNFRALVEHAAEEERDTTFGDHVACAISLFVGSMNFVYFHLAVFGIWVAINVGWLPGIHPFDPSFFLLGTVASCEAIFLMTFVLISQNRMSGRADTRNHLAVQFSLLTENETTHILRLVAAMSERMGIEAAKDPEMQELVRDVGPKEMLDRIEVHEEQVEHGIKKGPAGE